MRTSQQIDSLARVLFGGGTKTAAMLAGGYSPRSAQSNTNKALPRENVRHTRFVDGLFLFGWNKSKAARYAGYKPRWCGTNTARLMRHPDVRYAIGQIHNELFGRPSASD